MLAGSRQNRIQRASGVLRQVRRTSCGPGTRRTLGQCRCTFHERFVLHIVALMKPGPEDGEDHALLSLKSYREEHTEFAGLVRAVDAVQTVRVTAGYLYKPCEH